MPKPKGRRRLPPAPRRLPSPSDQVLTAGEVSLILRVSPSSVVRMTMRGELRRVPGIRRLLIVRSSLDALLQGQGQS